jgi:hypothetical protein
MFNSHPTLGAQHCGLALLPSEYLERVARHHHQVPELRVKRTEKGTMILGRASEMLRLPPTARRAPARRLAPALQPRQIAPPSTFTMWITLQHTILSCPTPFHLYALPVFALSPSRRYPEPQQPPPPHHPYQAPPQLLSPLKARDRRCRADPFSLGTLSRATPRRTSFGFPTFTLADTSAFTPSWHSARIESGLQ